MKKPAAVPLPSEAARAREGLSEAARVRTASRATTSPAELLALASDPEPTVRAAVALNAAKAPAAERRLVQDSDDRVRSLLAGKMARLLPGLSGNERSTAGAHVHGILRTLAHDAATRVRVALSEALHDLDEAPRDVILTLAHDPETTVSNPVLRYSPLLTETDLLELLATPPHDAAAIAVAGRPDLPARVATEIADHANSAAVTALLANQTASIQEATLDALVGRAGDHPEWHEPLVCRPALPARALRKLASLVAGHLFDKLAQRNDLPPGLAETLRDQIVPQLGAVSAAPDDDLLDRLQRLRDRGLLGEPQFLAATERGDVREASAILAVTSQVTAATLERAIALRSAKAIVSLAGRAEFGMQAAIVAQRLIGQITLEEVLLPGPDDAYPLTRAEMEWQVELLIDPVR